MVQHSDDMKAAREDDFFSNEVGRKVVRKLIKLHGGSSIETSLYALIRFDAVVTDALYEIESYSQKLQDAAILEQSFDFRPTGGTMFQPKRAN